MTFQKTTLKIAGIILLITLGGIGYIMYSTRSTLNYPPAVSSCPDYFIVADDKSCVDANGLNTKSGCSPLPDFSSATYSGSGGDKNKCEWAKNCNLTWDGITNVNLC